MAEPAFSLCVYCGSRPGDDPRFTDAALAVGEWIGRQGGQLVYGGGSSGLMGVVARATAAAGGRVVGVIPRPWWTASSPTEIATSCTSSRACTSARP